MRTSFWVALGIMLIGLLILMWPDTGEQLVRFNEAHGPSISDLIGIFLLLFTWAWMLIKTIARRVQVVDLLGKRKLSVTISVIFLGTLFIVWGLVVENDWLLFAGIFLAVSCWLVLFVAGFYSYTKERKAVGLPKERLN